MSLRYNNKYIPRAKELRKEMTPQERKLWYLFLRKYPIRFQRQKTVDCFILDFYCHKAKLAIELDGAYHFSSDGKAYDNERTAVLANYGLLVLRFSNFSIDNDFSTVCSQIDSCVKNRINNN